MVYEIIVFELFVRDVILDSSCFRPLNPVCSVVQFDDTTQDLSVSQLSQNHGADYMEEVA